MTYLYIILNVFFFQSDIEKAKILFHQKKYDEAIVLLEKAIIKDVNHVEANELLGDIYGQQMLWDQSIKHYRIIRDLQPKNANFHYKYGGSLGLKAKSINKFKALGLIDDVKLAFETAAKLDPNHIDTRWALVMFYVELPVIVGGSETKALNYADELMKLSKVDGYLAKAHIDSYYKRYLAAEKNYLKAHEIGQSQTTYDKLYDLYLNKLKDKNKAQALSKTFKKK